MPNKSPNLSRDVRKSVLLLNECCKMIRKFFLHQWKLDPRSETTQRCSLARKRSWSYWWYKGSGKTFSHLISLISFIDLKISDESGHFVIKMSMSGLKSFLNDRLKPLRPCCKSRLMDAYLLLPKAEVSYLWSRDEICFQR